MATYRSTQGLLSEAHQRHFVQLLVGLAGSEDEYSRSSLAFLRYPRGPGRIRRDFDHVTMPLYTGGQIKYAVDAAASQISAEEHGKTQATLDIKIDVVTAYTWGGERSRKTGLALFWTICSIDGRFCGPDTAVRS